MSAEPDKTPVSPDPFDDDAAAKLPTATVVLGNQAKSSPKEQRPVRSGLESFGDYEILGEIARGGMGIVYRARQISLNRIVALKVIIGREWARAGDILRFQQEAELAARLDHPHIVPIYEIGEHRGQHFFTMKLIEGKSLAYDPSRSLRSIASILERIVRAVYHAHQRGLLHRDLKPTNVLLDLKSHPYITDFGTAKRVETPGQEGFNLTMTGTVVGTPEYMAPEQARAEKVLTTGVDIYALGGILYYLLTGQPPFRSDSVFETLRLVNEVEPRAPHLLNAEVPRDLETICLKCLHKEPAKRYSTAEALAEDFGRWLNGEPIAARRVGRVERAVKWVKRKPATASVLLLAVLLLGALIGGGYWIDRERQTRNQEELRRQLTQAELLQQQAERKRLEEETASQTFLAEERRRQSLMDQARREKLEGNRWKALELLADAAKIRRTPELDEEAFHAATTPGARLVRDIIFQDAMQRDLSPDGRYLLLAGHPEGFKSAFKIGVWPTTDGPAVWHNGNIRDAKGIEWQRDNRQPPRFIVQKGRLLVAVQFQRPSEKKDAIRLLQLWDPIADKTVRLIAVEPSDALMLVNPSCTRAAIGTQVYDLIGDTPAVRVDLMPIAFVSDDEILLHLSKKMNGKDGGFELKRWNVAKQQTITSQSFAANLSLEGVSADGAIAVVSELQRNDELFLQIWDLQTATLIRNTRSQKNPRVVREMKRIRKETAEIPFAELVPYSRQAFPLLITLSRDGRTVAAEDRKGIALFDRERIERDGFIVELTSQRGLFPGRFSPTGTILAVYREQGEEGIVDLWDVETQSRFASLVADPEQTKTEHAVKWTFPRRLPIWSDDGQRVLTVGRRQSPDQFSPVDEHHRIWEVIQPVPAVLSGKSAHILEFAADGRTVRTGSTEWNLFELNGQTMLRPSLNRTGEAVALTPDGKWRLERPANHEVAGSLLHLKRNGETLPVTIPSNPVVGNDSTAYCASAFSPGGRYLLVAYSNSDPSMGKVASANLRRLEMWDLQAEQPKAIWRAEYASGEFLVWDRRAIPRGAAISFVPGASRCTVTGKNTSTVFDTLTGTGLGQFRVKQPETEKAPPSAPESVSDQVMSMDGQRLWCSFWEMGRIISARLPPSPDGAISHVAEVIAHRGHVTCLALDAADKILASGGSDKRIRLWDAATLKLIASWDAHDREIAALAFSPDGRTLVSTGRDGMLKVWSLSAISVELHRYGLGWTP